MDGGTYTDILVVNEEYHKYTSEGVIVERETYELECNPQESLSWRFLFEAMNVMRQSIPFMFVENPDSM